MAAGNISNAAILASAKESTTKIDGNTWIEIITKMVNTGYVNNSKDNWFKTEGNSVKYSDNDTAVTETVVNVAKVVKEIAKGEETSTITLDGIVTSVNNVDLLAGILRVMGFYDSEKVTVEKYAKELLDQIDFSKTDRLSTEDTRALISYLNSDAKILVERDTINDLYNQLLELGVTKTGKFQNGSVADNTIFKSYTYPERFYVRNVVNMTCLSKPKQLYGIKYSEMYDLLPSSVSLIFQRGIAELATKYPDFRNKLDDDTITHYITIYYDNDNIDHVFTYNFRITLVNKNNLPFLSFGSSVVTKETKDSDNVVYVKKAEAEDEGGILYRDYENDNEYIYNVPGLFSWSTIKIAPPIFKKTKIQYLIPRVNSIGLKSEEISTDNIYYDVIDGVDINYSASYDEFNIIKTDNNNTLTFDLSAIVQLECPENESELYTYELGVFDNFTDGSNLPEIKADPNKPNFKSRIDSSNKDLVQQLEMTTKNFGRYGEKGSEGENIYAVFNSVAGDSSTSDDSKNADKITDGNITKDQKDTLEDDTSNAKDDTEDQDKTGETTGTADDSGFIPKIPSTFIAKRSMFNLYQVNETVINTLADYMWSEDFVNKFLKVYSDPQDAIISLHVLPVSAKDVTKDVDVILGNVDLNVNSTLVNAYQETYTAGVIDITHYNHDVRDYSPYSEYYLYLPFIGIVALNSEDVVGSKLTIYYDIDLVTGSILARVWVERKELNACLYQFTGSCIYRLPTTKLDQSNIIDVAMRASIGAISGGLTGGGIRAGAQAIGEGFNALQSHVSQGGSIGGNASITASPYPYLIVKHKTPQTAVNFNKFYGRPTLKTVTLTKEKGFVKVRDINLTNINFNSEELDELENILKEGIIL